MKALGLPMLARQPQADDIAGYQLNASPPAALAAELPTVEELMRELADDV